MLVPDMLASVVSIGEASQTMNRSRHTSGVRRGIMAVESPCIRELSRALHTNHSQRVESPALNNSPKLWRVKILCCSPPQSM